MASSSSRRLSFSPRLADLIPQPRRNWHRYHGVFAPNHPLRPAVTALAVGNVGKQRDAATGGEPLEPPPISPARGPPTDWGELVQVHDDRDVFQSTDRRAARDRHPQPLTAAGREVTTKSPGGPTRRDSAPTREKRHFRGGRGTSPEQLSRPGQPREAGATDSRAAHPSGNGGGSAIDRAILFGMLLSIRSGRQNGRRRQSPASGPRRAHGDR